MAKSRSTDLTTEQTTEQTTQKRAVPQTSSGTSELAAALVSAIELTRPEQKKNAFNRKIGTPWTPKDGSAKLKLKRRMYQHGIPADEDILSNTEIDLMNKLKPGTYLSGVVRVNRRKDRGIDIDYHVKTASQRLKLVNQFGIRNLSELLERCIEESNNPVKYAVPDLE